MDPNADSSFTAIWLRPSHRGHLFFHTGPWGGCLYRLRRILQPIDGGIRLVAGCHFRCLVAGLFYHGSFWGDCRPVERPVWSTSTHDGHGNSVGPGLCPHGPTHHPLGALPLLRNYFRYGAQLHRRHCPDHHCPLVFPPPGFNDRYRQGGHRCRPIRHSPVCQRADPPLRVAVEFCAHRYRRSPDSGVHGPVPASGPGCIAFEQATENCRQPEHNAGNGIQPPVASRSQDGPIVDDLSGQSLP